MTVGSSKGMTGTKLGRPAQVDDYAAGVEAVVRLLTSGEDDSAEKQLRTLASPPQSGSDSTCRDIPYDVQLRTFRRDGFMCRYCGRRTIFPPILRLLAARFPAVLRYHLHWKMSECDLAFWREVASCDHLVPVSRGGGSEQDNLLTACYMCNSMKQNWLIEELMWDVLPPSSEDWDGLSSFLRELVSIVPTGQERYYQNWLGAMELIGAGEGVANV